MKNIFKNIGILWRNNRRRQIYEQLQQQRFLLRTGIPATAQILDMVQEESEMNDFVQMRFWVMLKMQGGISYQHIQTLMNKKDIPAVGQVLQIRCLPQDWSTVVVV